MRKKIDDQELIELHNNGLMHKEIAQSLGYSVCYISQRLNKLGYSTYHKDSRKEIEQLHNKGLQDNEIAEILGCTRSNVTILLNRMGYSNRRSQEKPIDVRNRISNKLIGRYTGENNPNYKGYNDEKKVARGIFKTFSKRLIRENNFTCSVCGKRGGDLETHHIKPFNIIFDEFIRNKYDGNKETLYDQLMSYEEFIDESNLVVLCHDCHWKIHYSDNPELSPYRWESATTIESTS
jgi:transcriptional regulator